MIGVENGPTPEEMGIPPSEMEVSTSDSENQVPEVDNVAEVQQPNESEQALSQPQNENKEPKPDDKPHWGEITQEQQEGIDEVMREVVAGLGMLYDILPHSGTLNDDRIVKVLNELKTVQTMGPVVKNKIASVIVRDDLHTEHKEDFVLKLLKLEYVDFWIHSQGSSRGSDGAFRSAA
jgi:hypothetical protein